MAKAYPASKTWQQRVALQDAMARAKALIAESKFGQALDAIDATQLLRVG